MKSKASGRVLWFLMAVSWAAVSMFVLFPETEASGQDKGWKVWVKTSPCSGRHDWVSVAKENPTPPGGELLV